MDQKSENSFSLWLDFFRWIAAFLVLFTHTTNRFMLPSSEIHSVGFLPFRYLFSFFSGFSHQAVIVFFVLSGFLVGGGLVREFERTGNVDVPAYLIKRLSRLWTVLIPAFALSFACQWVAVHSFGAVSSGILPPTIGTHSNLTSLACNVLFMQTALCNQYADNGPLWSLFNEFWYYAVWPLLFFALSRTLGAWFRLISAVAATALLVGLTWLQFTGSPFAPYMLLWLIGVAVAVLKRPVVKSTFISAGLLVLFLLAARVAIRRDSPLHAPIGEFAVDTVVALLFGHLVLAMRVSQSLLSPPLGRINKFFADFSFTLYCIHVPLLTLYLAAVVHWRGYGWHMKLATPTEWAVMVAPLAALPLLAYGFSLVTERHTDTVKSFFIRIYRQLAATEGPTESPVGGG